VIGQASNKNRRTDKLHKSKQQIVLLKHADRSKEKRSRSVDTKSLQPPPLAIEMNNSRQKYHNLPNQASKANINSNRCFDNQHYEPDLEQVLGNQFIDFKLLEAKSEQERQKLSNIMQKLEVDLINAKLDLLEEDCIKPITTYPTTNSSANKLIKPTNKMTNSYTSSISNSTSGIMATTGPSSSSSSVSTSPPLYLQQKTLLDTNDHLTMVEAQTGPEPNRKTSKNIRLLLVNKPRRLPRRRHTIAARNECPVNKDLNLLSGVIFSSSSDYSESEDFGHEEQVKNIRSCNKKKRTQAKYRSKTVVKLTSRSITDLSGLETINKVGNQEMSSSKNEEVVLNLSPLSMSASSITISSGSEDDEENNPEVNCADPVFIGTFNSNMTTFESLI